MKTRFDKWRRSLKRKSRSGLLRRFYVAVFVLLLLAFGWGLYRVISYAYESPALKVSSISVSGLTRVSEVEVLARAGFSAGTSILSLDLDRMRTSIENLRWVRHARVQRVWPREIVISVIERDPIALARIDGQIFQVDDEGVILPVDSLTIADSPILDGLFLDDMEGNRAKIRIYSDTLDLIGEDVLSEVHITDKGEVSVVPSTNPVVVVLGLDQHLERWQRYLQYSPQIERDFPGASRVDLRFKDQVVVDSGGDEPVGTISWEEEARLL